MDHKLVDKETSNLSPNVNSKIPPALRASYLLPLVENLETGPRHSRPDDTKDAHSILNLGLQDETVGTTRPNNDIKSPPPVPYMRSQDDATRPIVIEERPPPPRRRVVSNFRLARLPIIETYEGLFPRKDDDDSYCLYDRYVLLLPFNKRCYVTNASFTIHDLHKYSWLLAQSEERWYTMPTTSELVEIRKSGLRELDPIEEPKPAGLDTPCLVIGEAFTLFADLEESVERDTWGDCGKLHPTHPVTPSTTLSLASSSDKGSEDGKDDKEDKTEKDDTEEVPSTGRNKWACPLCYEERNKLLQEVGWVYLSVVRAEVQGVRSSQGNGMGMFMLKKHGSREAAVATAFSDAGVRGWSTVFSCAVRADVHLLGWKGEMRRVTQIEDLLLDRQEVLTVFF